MPHVAPSSVAVASEAATAIQLSWTVGDGDHYDVYRAPMRSSGFFGPFAKVNSSNVAIAATGFTDQSGSSLDPPVGNQHYCYIVYAVDAVGSLKAGNPVFATSYQNTDALQAIQEAIEARVASVLGAEWAEMPYRVNPEKNNVKTRDKGYGVIPDAAPLVDGQVRSYNVGQRFFIQLTRGVVKNSNDDSLVMTACLEAAELMEQISIDLVQTKCGAPSVAAQVSPITKNPPQWLEEENMVLLVGELTVQFRIRL